LRPTRRRRANTSRRERKNKQKEKGRGGTVLENRWATCIEFARVFGRAGVVWKWGGTKKKNVAPEERKSGERNW